MNNPAAAVVTIRTNAAVSPFQFRFFARDECIKSVQLRSVADLKMKFVS